MLASDRYAALAAAPEAKRVSLYARACQYRRAHELPGWHAALAPVTRPPPGRKATASKISRPPHAP
jgi:hypothetical protein